MAQTTEAACLLQSGSMYGRRLGLRTASGESVFAGIKPGAVSLYFDDAPIYHFDLDGRWQRAFIDGMHYLKGIDATVRSIARDREEGSLVLHRSTLAYAQSVDLDDLIRSMALGLIDDLDAARLEIDPPPSGSRPFEAVDLRDFLERVAGWDSAAWFAHRERYLGTYGPIPFVPPDGPNALVLQATLGNLDGRAFGRARVAEHYVRSSSEFREHVQAVSRVIGRRVSQYRGVFLGGADVLRRPVAEILDWLATINQHFPIDDLRSRPRVSAREGLESQILFPPLAKGGSGGVSSEAMSGDRPETPPLPPPWQGGEPERDAPGTRPDSIPPGDRSDPNWDECPTRLGMVHAFLDDFRRSGLPDLEGWQSLRAANLGRVTLGVESGDPAIRSTFAKTWQADDLRNLVAELKMAKIGVGLVVLIGAGGRAMTDRHIESSAALIGSLPLEAGDLVSLVDVGNLDESPDDPLSVEESTAQVAALKERSAIDRPSKGPKLIAYNPDKHWS